MSKWQKVKLGDICNFIKGETGIAKAEAGKYPLVVTGKERKTCDSFQLDCKAVCIPLVSSSGHGKASLNYVHYQEGKFALGSILVAVIPEDANVINAQFLHLYLSRLKDSLLVPLMKGSANVALSVSAVKGVEISLPKIEKQIEIINLFNQIDLDHQELAKENTNQKTYLTQLRQAILQEAIEGKLTADWRVKNPAQKDNPNFDATALLEQIKAEKQRLTAEGKIKKEKPLAPINPDDVPFALPDGWVWCHFQDITTAITCGIASTPTYHERGRMFLSAKNIKPYKFMPEKHKFVNENTYQGIINNAKPEIGDILMTRVGAGIGESAIIDQELEFAYYVSLTLIKPLQEFVVSPYILHFLNSSYGIKNAISYSTGKGSSQGNLNVNSVRSYMIPFPALAEQNAIVERVDRLLESVNALELQVTEREDYAQQLMQAVLREAFTS